MKRIVIFARTHAGMICFFSALLFLIVMGCKKSTSEINSHEINSKNYLTTATKYLQEHVSKSVFNNCDFDNATIYRLKENTAAVRIPLIINETKSFVMLATTNGTTWFGNYVTIIKDSAGAGLRTLAIKTISFDSSKIEINQSGSQTRVYSMAAPVINTGVPGILWLGFTNSIQQQYPSAFANWYYPENTSPPSNGGGSPASTNTLYYDPYVADNVIIGQKLRDSFPCAIKILDTVSSVWNLNQRAQVALNEIFNIGKKVHLTFTVEDTWTKDSIDGDTKVDSAWVATLENGSEGLDFYATIRLNPWLLKNGTKEYIAATVVHETFHAYIEFKYYQYLKNVIDSNTFKSLFPLYWPPKTLGGGFYLHPNELTQHNVMAANLIEQLSSPLWAFTNNELSYQMKDSMYRTLSWAGLGRTTVWRLKPDTCNIKPILIAARDTSLGAGHSTGLFHIPGCSGNNSVSYTSLNLKTPCQ